MLLPNAARAAVVAEVVLGKHTRTPAVEVYAVADIAACADVVDVVAADGGAGREAQRIDPAAVIEHAHDVMHVIVLDEILARSVVGDLPVPAERDTCIAEVGDLVMRDSGVACDGHEDAGRSRMDMPSVVNEVVVHGVVMRDAHELLRAVGRADLHTTRAEIVQMRALDGVARAVRAEEDAIAAGMGDLAVAEGAVAGGGELKRSSEGA